VPPPESVEIASARACLQRSKIDDARDIASAVGDARFPPNDSWRLVRSEADAAARLREQRELWDERRAFHFSVRLSDSGAFVGQIVLSREPDTDTWLLGYWTAPCFWRRGLATEAAAAGIDYAFRELGATGLRAGATPDNLASLRVLEKLGFRFQLENPEGYRLAGRWLTTREYTLERALWQALRTA